MKALVTGGAGFIGSHVVDAYVAEGHEVVVLDLLLPSAHARRPRYLNPAARLIEADLRDVDTVASAVAGVDLVSHQASLVGLGRDLGDLSAYVGHNDLGTAALLEAMYRSGFDGRLCLASSMVVYGEGSYRCPEHGTVAPSSRTAADLAAGSFEPGCPLCQQPLAPAAVSEDAPTEPTSIYAITKLVQERLCMVYAQQTGVAVTALRYHNVYGPRMPKNTPYSGVAAIFRSALEEGRAADVFEDGGQLRDFIHVSDVARANLLAGTMPQPPQGAFNIATGTPRTILELAKTLTDARGDAPAPVITGEFRKGDVRHVFASPQKAATELGFEAEIPFEDGMRAFAFDDLREIGATPLASEIR